AVDRISPQIAEHAGEWTLRAGEKDRERLFDIAGRPALGVDRHAVRPPGIDRLFRRPRGARRNRAAQAANVDRKCRRYRASSAGKSRATSLAPADPCWNRRLGKIGMSTPSTARTPRLAISPLSAYNRSCEPSVS